MNLLQTVVKSLFILIVLLPTFVAIASPDPTPTHETFSNAKPAMATAPAVNPKPVPRSKSDRRAHTFHADKGVREIFLEELNDDQKVDVEKAKKILPPNETDIENIRVYQTPLGLWITVAVSEKSGEYFEIYEILSKKDSKPILFYKHERAIDILTSHKGRLILIDDFPATKSSEILIEDLKTKKNWHIDRQLIARYHQEVNAEGYLVLPVPIAFSPDDRKVLIRMSCGYVYSHTPEDAGIFQKKYDNWSYVIDPKSGKILREFNSASFPEKWWLNN